MLEMMVPRTSLGMSNFVMTQVDILAINLDTVSITNSTRLKELNGLFDDESMKIGTNVNFTFERKKRNLRTHINIVFSENDNKLICANFDLNYKLMTNPPPKEHEHEIFKMFSNIGALLNVWPYWREIVRDLTGRMGLKPTMIPPLVVSPQEEPEPMDVPVMEMTADGNKQSSMGATKRQTSKNQSKSTNEADSLKNNATSQPSVSLTKKTKIK
jgi:hypothetical protein